MLLEEGANEVDVGSEISSLIQEPEFPARDEYGSVSRAYQLYPREVAFALVRRIEAASEVPYWALDELRTASIAIDDGPIVDLVLGTDTSPSTANAAAIVAGPRIIRRALDEIVEVRAALRAMSPSTDEPTRKRCWRLSELMVNASDSSFVDALLARPTIDTPAEIALLADQLARNHSHDEQDAVANHRRKSDAN